MDWIHCNSCFDQPKNNESDTKLQFYITSCGHIFCEKCGCFADGTRNCCKFCRNMCSSTLIGEKSFRTNPQILEYFQDPEEVCEKLFKVIKFQKGHRTKLIRHHQYMLSKYNKAKTYIKQLESELVIVKNTLRNTPKKFATDVKTNQSLTTSIFHPNFFISKGKDSIELNSTPFKMINAESKICSIPSLKHNNFPTKFRKHTF